MIFSETLILLIFCTTISYHTEEVLVEGEIYQIKADSFQASFEFTNISEELVFLFIPDELNYSISTNTFLNFDIGSSYITDPLSFPRYRILLHPIFPGESYKLNENYSGNSNLLEEVFIGFDYFNPDKATGRLKRKLRRFAKYRKSGVVYLIDYYQYQDKYGTQYGNFIKC